MKPSSKEELKVLPVLKVVDLIKYVSGIVEGLLSTQKVLLDDFTNEIWILFDGDKGGKHMKFHFEVINTNSSGSVFVVHMFAMYEASDSYDNMAKIILLYRPALIEMQSETFRISGYKVKAFLGGDFHFLDDCLGHQGSAASYPSAKDLVTLEHLRNHGGKPHMPAHCFIDLRSLSDYESSYNENLAEDRMGGDLHKTGKFHESIVARSIFPIALENVVPLVLHIMLGIVLKLYKILLKTAQNLDSLESTATRQGRPRQEWGKQAGS